MLCQTIYVWIICLYDATLAEPKLFKVHKYPQMASWALKLLKPWSTYWISYPVSDKPRCIKVSWDFQGDNWLKRCTSDYIIVNRIASSPNITFLPMERVLLVFLNEFVNDLDGTLEFSLLFRSGLYLARSTAASLWAPIIPHQIFASPKDASV